MYLDGTAYSRLNPSVTEFLEGLEAQGHPIRVLYGGWREYHPFTWTQDQADATPFSLTDCQDNGITIVSCGTPTPSLARDTQIPIDLLNPAYCAYQWGPRDQNRWPATAYLYDRLEFDSPHHEVVEYGPCNLLAIDGSTIWVATNVELFGEGQGQMLPLNVLSDAIESMLDPALADERRRLAAERNRERFIAMMTQVGSTEQDNLVSEIEGLARNVSNYERRLFATRTELRSKQQLLDAYLAAGEDDPEELAERVDIAWTRMHNDPRIERITLGQDSVTLLTAPLNITHPDDGRVAYLGRFRWTMNTRDFGVNVTNLDNPRGGFDHPHVNNGGPCFGEMGDTIYELLRQGRLESAIEMIFVFLASANPRDDWGRRIAYWFTPDNMLDEVIDRIDNDLEDEEDVEEYEPEYA